MTGTNDAPTSENFSVNLENGFADINFDPHVADVEDDFLPDDGRVLDEVRIDGLPTFGTLIDNDGNPISAGDMVSLDEVTYVANPTIDLSDEVSGGFALGYTGGDAGASLDNWGVDNGGVREYDLGGVTVTTSVSAGTLTQYNNDEGDGGHIGNGIADDSGQGLNQGDLLTVDFGGVGVTSVNLGLDGLGGHFGPDGSSATVTVVYADGSAETFDYNKANGGDDEFLAVSLTAGSDNPIASLQFTTTEGGGFTGSNWELRYVEVPSNSIVLDDTFTYTPEDSDGAFGNTSTVTINGLESFDNTPPTISQGGPKLMGGLLSEFYVSDSQIGNLEQFKQLIADNDPEALFISTGLSYGLGYGDVGQGTNLEGFLNDDAASLTVGADQRSDSNDAGVRIFGDVSLNAGTYVLKVRADDGFEINIGGQTVAGHPNNQAPKTSYHEFTLTEGGALPIEVLWWDQGGRYVLEVDIAEGSIGDSDLDLQAFAHSEQSPWCHQLVETNSGLVTMGVLDIGDINAAQVVTVSLGEEDPTVVSDWDGATGIDFSGMLNLVGDSNVLDHSETADQMYYVFDSGSEAFDGLDYGETITVTYQVFATDGGATTEGSISVEIQGTNDKPAFSVSPVTRAGYETDGPLVVNNAQKGTVLFQDTEIDTVETAQMISELTIQVSGLVDGAEEQLLIGQAISLVDGSYAVTYNGLDLTASVTLVDGVATVVLTPADGEFTVVQAEYFINAVCFWHTHPGGTATSGVRTIEIVSMSDSGDLDDPLATSPLAEFSGLTADVWVGSTLKDSGKDNIHENGNDFASGNHGGTSGSEMILFSDITAEAENADKNGSETPDDVLLLSGNGGNDLFVAINRDFVGDGDGGTSENATNVVKAVIDDFVIDVGDTTEVDSLDLSALLEGRPNAEVNLTSTGADSTVSIEEDSVILAEITLSGLDLTGAGLSDGTTLQGLIDENIIRVV